jgi:hypothetical protein
MGLSLGRVALATDVSTSPDYTLRGGGLALDVLVGGSPAPGVAVGGGLLVAAMTAADLEIEGSTNEIATSAGHVLIGPFIDGFPQPTGGFHLGGLLGLAQATIDRDDQSTDERFEGGGFGGAAWVGYDWWVGPEWSLGGLLRMTGSITRDEDEALTRQATNYGFALLFTALYH